METNYKIRELRDAAGMTQKAFAEHFGIPLSTLRKWEQGEASPAEYVVKLIAGTLPALDASRKMISGRKNTRYYYDADRKTISDEKGNEIRVTEDLFSVKEQNLPLYLEDLFEDFYIIQEKFNRDCRFDREENIIWTRAEG